MVLFTCWIVILASDLSNFHSTIPYDICIQLVISITLEFDFAAPIIKAIILTSLSNRAALEKKDTLIPLK